MEKENEVVDQKHLDRPMLTGLFVDREGAENAYNAMFERGYQADDINLVMSDETRTKSFPKHVPVTDMDNKATEGLAKGSAIGGAIGAIVGIIAAIGTGLLIPGRGIVIAGPVLGGLAGAGAGGITGGMIGALIGVGIPEERARTYEAGIQEGRILMGVYPKNEADASFFIQNWRSNRALEIHN
ncbi:MAG TPA: hypothetical protein DHW64_01235 [Chitinophagaceae bacterium]|nr:hypothetical protein [Chitinophagaceae bacterium]